MKSSGKNLYRVRIVFAIVIVIFCVGAFYVGIKRDMTPVSEDREEAFREFIANELEETLTSYKNILSCNVDFEVDNNAITKAYLTLDCAEILRPETEDSIKQTVAGAMNLSTDDISISY